MKDQRKSREQLRVELHELRQRVAELESSTYYKHTAELSFEAFVVHDCGICLEANSRFFRMFGYEPHELLGKQAIPLLVAPEYVDLVNMQEAKESSGLYEVVAISKDGMKIPCEVRSKLIDYRGRKARLAACRDISHIKAANERLRESREIYRELTDSINDVFFAMDRDLKYTYWNRASERLTGIPAEYAIGKSLYEVFRQVKGTKAEKAYLEVLKTSEARSFETEYRLGNKDYIFEISAYPSKEGLSVFVKDITDRKQAQEQLRAKEEEIRLITDNVPALIAYIDSNNCYRFANKKCFDWFGISPEDTVGKHCKLIIGKTAYRQIRDRVKKALSGQRVSFEDEIRYKYGGTRRVKAGYIPDFDKSGKVKGFFVLVTDITQEKKAENYIKKIEELLFRMEENIQEIFWLGEAGESRRMTYLSPVFEKIWGRKRQEVYADEKIMLEAIHEQDRDRFARLFADFVQGRGDLNTEFRVRRPDGSVSWLWIKGLLVRNEAGKPHRSAGIIQDITKRKLAEEALRKSEERYRTLVDNIPGAVYRYNKDRSISFISDEIEKISGYPSSYFAGRNVNSFTGIIHPEDLETFNRATSNRLVYKKPVEAEYRLACRDGNIRWVRDICRMILDENNELIWIDGVLLDITERKEAEAKLLESRKKLRYLAAHLQTAREDERTRIAREIHDELGQTLTALKLDLSRVGKKLLNGLKIPVERIQSMSRLADTALKTVKRISAELRPPLLDDLGLTAAIEWQAKDFEKRSCIRTSVAIKDGHFIISEESKTAIFRIFQEALTNVAQHAEATRVDIILRVIGNDLELIIEDNGKGIAEEQIFSAKSLGLLGMRERVQFLDGEMSIEGAPNGGTRILVKIPLANEQ
jgi:PAS domain S-box-containing protein